MLKFAAFLEYLSNSCSADCYRLSLPYTVPSQSCLVGRRSHQLISLVSQAASNFLDTSLNSYKEGSGYLSTNMNDIFIRFQTFSSVPQHTICSFIKNFFNISINNWRVVVSIFLRSLENFFYAGSIRSVNVSFVQLRGGT